MINGGGGELSTLYLSQKHLFAQSQKVICNLEKKNVMLITFLTVKNSEDSDL